MTHPLGPTDLELDALEQEDQLLIEDGGEEDLAEESAISSDNPLEDLFQEAAANRKLRRPAKKLDPAARKAAELSAQRSRTLYSNPENWERKRGLALIDKETQTLIGNFSEWTHRTVLNTRKLIREHQPIEIHAVEEVEGFLGERLEQTIRNVSWEKEHFLVADMRLDELMVSAPEVPLRVLTSMGAITRLELVDPTQFASESGNVLFQLAPGTDLLQAASTDSKIMVRRILEALQ